MVFERPRKTTTKRSTTTSKTTTTMKLSSTVNNVLNCDGEKFQCGDGSCISARWVCDRVTDCIDKSDETNCSFYYDYDTELNAPYPSVNSIQSPIKASGKHQDENSACEPDQFECRFETFCIPDRWVCDNQIDCKDGSDESECEANEINF